MAAKRNGVSRPYALVGSVWLATRVVLAVVLAGVMISERLTFTQAVSRWDVLHFTAIAQNGYAVPNDRAFFPGLPALLAFGARVGVPMAVSGTALALVASLLAAVALVRVGGPALGPIAACLWLLAPNAIFTAVPYTEALFCAAAFWAWCNARDDHWMTAGVCAGFACAFRVSGLFLVGALGLLAIAQVWRKRGWLRDLLAKWAWMLIPLVVLGGFEVYLFSVTGSWTAWLQAEQAGWARGFVTPWQSFHNTFVSTPISAWPGRPEVSWLFRAEIVAMATGLVGAIWCLLKRRWAEFGLIGVQLLAFGTSYWYMSVNRAVLGWFPVFLMLAGLIAWRPQGRRARVVWRVVVVLAIAADVVVMCAWAWLFLTGHWAG